MADSVAFSGTVKGLQPGDNIITFEAEDAAGKKIQVQRTVNYTGPALEPLADNGELYGYGEHAIDANASYQKYTVTNLNDTGAGSLREGLSATGAHSVRVDPALAGGHIHLASQIPIRGKKECDFGNLITTGGDRFSISGGSATHVAFQNIKLGAPTGRHTRDAIVVFQGANDLNLWFDKITSNGENDDGLIDIVGHYDSQGSTNYPAGRVLCSKSRMRLNGGYKEFLYGSNSSDYAAKNIYVTWYRCYVDGTTYRLPFVRYATVDLVNCWVNNWGAAPGASGKNEVIHANHESRILTRNCIYTAGAYTRVVNYTNGGTEPAGYVRGEGLRLENGAVFRENSPSLVPTPSYSKPFGSYMVAADDNLKTLLLNETGAG